jgi:hypothetical protein
MIINVTSSIIKMPQDYTFSFWFLYLEGDLTVDPLRSYNYDILKAFGRISVQIKRPAKNQKHLIYLQEMSQSFANTM